MTDREFIADWKGFTNSSEMYDAQEMGRLFAEVVDRLDALVKANEDRDLTKGLKEQLVSALEEMRHVVCYYRSLILKRSPYFRQDTALEKTTKAISNTDKAIAAADKAEKEDEE